MPCTTILVGKKASYDGSTMIARNDDSGAGHYTSKKFVVIHPEEQPRTYKTEISHLTIELPDNPMRYTAVPNAEKGEGVWAASGVNAAQVGMTATETITSNPRVLGADPLVVYQPAEDGKEEVPGGIGEEDLVYIVLPYIKSAREGVKRLGSLLEQYGTYEMNGIAFQDHDEIWWLETIGGHHWMAVKVPDDHYVAMPNQLGIDHFDLEDALGEQKEYMCSADLKEFIETYHLDLSMDGNFNPRDAFGSHDDSDHVYNTPRAWFMERYLTPHTKKWDGPNADYTPVSDDIPWMMVPEKKITVENPSDTRIMQITITDKDAALAQSITQDLAEVTAKTVAEKMDVKSPTIIENAYKSEQPDSPSLKKNVAIGAILGFILMAAAIVIQYLMNDTILKEDDIEKYLGINTLAQLPLVKGTSKRTKKVKRAR